MKQFYFNKINEKLRRYYSLNFLFATFEKFDKSENNRKKNISLKYKDNNLPSYTFHKKTSTII